MGWLPCVCTDVREWLKQLQLGWVLNNTPHPDPNVVYPIDIQTLKIMV